MTDSAVSRKQLAALLRQSLLEYAQDGALRVGSYDNLMRVIDGCPGEVWAEDRSLCAAWHFADTFFDAIEDAGALGVVPDLTSGRELSLQEAEDLMEHIVERFEQGLDITDPVVLAYSRYCTAESASEALPGCLGRLRAVAGWARLRRR